MFSACFYKVGDMSRAETDTAAYGSWVGVSTIMNNNLFFYGIFVSILQMPLWVPIMKRELMNRMYSTTTYFYGRVASCIFFQLVYPLLITLICFWFLGIQLNFKNFCLFVLNGLGICFNGCAIGFLFGNLFENDENSRHTA